jgi:leucyl-tRNA synthetase
MINAFSPEIFSFQEIPNLISKKELKQNKQIDYSFVIKYDLPIKRIFQIEKQEENKLEVCLINSPLINDLKSKNEAIEIIDRFLEKEKRGHVGNFCHLKD